MSLEKSADSSFLKSFVFSAAGVLMITGVAKVSSALGKSNSLVINDPIFGIQFKYLILAVGVLEITIALACCFSRRQRLTTALLAWLATSFAIYRLDLWSMHWHRPCGCLGNLTAAVHISPHLADNIMKVVLAYLLIGSYATILWQCKRGRVPRPVPAASGAPV